MIRLGSKVCFVCLAECCLVLSLAECDWGPRPDCAVVFSPGSRGQLALVIFEWKDAKYLGVDQSGNSTDNQWEDDVSTPPPRSAPTWFRPSQPLGLVPPADPHSPPSQTPARLHLQPRRRQRKPLRRYPTRTVHPLNPFRLRHQRLEHLHCERPVRPRRERAALGPRQGARHGALQVPGGQDRLLLRRCGAPYA